MTRPRWQFIKPSAFPPPACWREESGPVRTLAGWRSRCPPACWGVIHFPVVSAAHIDGSSYLLHKAIRLPYSGLGSTGFIFVFRLPVFVYMDEFQLVR